MGLLGLLQFLSSLRANSKILGEARSAEFGRRQAPAEKPNRSITAAAEAEAGGREIFIRAEKRQQKVDVFAHPKWGGETHVFSGEARQRSSSLKENLDVREGDRGGSCRYQSPSLFLFPNPPALVCGGGSRNRRALFSSVRRRCLLGLLGLLQFLSSLRANSKILGEARSAEFGRRQAPAEKPNRSITAAAEAEAGGREIFIRAEKRQQKVDVFAHPKWGGETHVFSGEARQRSSSLKENLDVREGDRGGSCRYQSPSLFLFPSGIWPARSLGRSRKTTPRWASSPAFNHL